MIEIAKELGVTHILEGSFNKSGDEIKIVLQLINGATDDHFWSDEYRGTWNTNDIFKIQAEVAENVTKNLNLNISQEEIRQISKAPTQNTEAYKAYLQAEFQSEKNDRIGFSNALPLYEKAIELDPMFYEAYDGLAKVWWYGGLIWGQFDEAEALSKSKTLLEKSIKIKDHFSARKSLFSLEFFFNWNFNYCEQEIENMKQNVRGAEEDVGVGDYLMKVGRYQESVDFMNSYMNSKDLAESFTYAHKAKALFLAGRTNEALEIINKRQAFYLDDQFFLRESILIHFYAKNYPRFQELANIINTNFSDRAPVHIWFDLISSNLGSDRVAVDKYMKELESKYKNHESGSPAWFAAMYYFFIKDAEKGFTWLQLSFDRHEVEMTWLREEPLLQPFISDPRYQKMYKAMSWPFVNGR
jgi:tetratricopeptide (TPR) repeat protein